MGKGKSKAKKIIPSYTGSSISVAPTLKSPAPLLPEEENLIYNSFNLPKGALILEHTEDGFGGGSGGVEPVQEGIFADTTEEEQVDDQPEQANQDQSDQEQLILVEEPVYDQEFWDKAKEAGALGMPFLVASPDIEDQSMTVTYYDSPDNDPEKGRMVLFAKLVGDGENKLLDAIKIDDLETINPEADRVLNSDKKHDLYPKLLKFAKSINHHKVNGSTVPDATVSGLSNLSSEIDMLIEKNKNNPPVNDPHTLALHNEELKMLEHYKEAVTMLQKAEGKTPKFKQYLMAKELFDTKAIGATDEEALLAKRFKGSRIDGSINGDRALWDGESRQRKDMYGHEYVIDLGDGYTAVYHPNDSSVPFSYRGTVEVISPKGTNNGEMMLSKLQKLHLEAAPPRSLEEIEAMYLERNVWAQNLTDDPEYKHIKKEIADVKLKLEAEITAQMEMASASELSEEEQKVFAKLMVQEAERATITHRTAKLKQFFENQMKAKGKLKEGQRLEDLPGYQPVPKAVEGKKGFHVWNRFDVTPDEIKKKFSGKKVVHYVGSNSDMNRTDRICAIIEAGGIIASTEMRSRMGIKVKTMSPEADQASGGANYAFCRLQSASSLKGQDFVWEPETMLQRSDWFAASSDVYGAINKADSHYNQSILTKDFDKLKEHSGSSNEIMFKNGIDIFGQHAPSTIYAESISDRERILKSFAKVSVTHLKGKPVEDVVKVR